MGQEISRVIVVEEALLVEEIQEGRVKMLQRLGNKSKKYVIKEKMM